MATAAGAMIALGGSGVAHGAIGFLVDSREDGSDPSVYAQVFGTTAEVTTPMRLRILRAGAVLDDRLGSPVKVFAGVDAMSEVGSQIRLTDGDRVEWYMPSDAPVPTRVAIWYAQPTLDTCPVGSQYVGGRADDFVAYLWASVWRHPGSPYGTGWQGTENFPVRTPGFWTWRVDRRLMRGDIVSLWGRYHPQSDVQLSRRVQYLAGECRPSTERRRALVFDGDDGALAALRARDVKQRKAVVSVRVRCLAASRIPCRGRAALATTSRVKVGKKRRKLTLGSRPISLAPGKARTLKVKVSKTGRKVLAGRARLASRVSAVTRDPAGDALTKTRKTTLRGTRKRAGR